MTKGKVADILASRGQLDEALRILEHDVAPAFERLGDVRALAVAKANCATLFRRRDAVGERNIAKTLLRRVGFRVPVTDPEAETIARMLEALAVATGGADGPGDQLV